MGGGGWGCGNEGSSVSSTQTKPPDGDQPEQALQAETEGDASEQEEGVTQAEVDEAWERARAMEVSQRVGALQYIFNDLVCQSSIKNKISCATSLLCGPG